jgi:hypothetical protein
MPYTVSQSSLFGELKRISIHVGSLLTLLIDAMTSVHILYVYILVVDDRIKLRYEMLKRSTSFSRRFRFARVLLSFFAST